MSLSKGVGGLLGLSAMLLTLACGGSSSGGGGGGSGTVWSPSSAAPLHLHWQLSGDLDPVNDLPLLVHRTVFDLDGELTPASTVAALHAMGDEAPDCDRARAWHLNSMRRDLDLVGPRDPDYLYQPCLADTAAAW